MMFHNTDRSIIPLGKVTYESTTRARDQKDYDRSVYGVDRVIGLTPSPKYVADSVERYKIINPGMFAYNPMRLNIGSIGYCSVNHEPGLVSPDYVVFGCRDELSPDFMYYITRTVEWQKWTAEAGVGSVRTRIYYRELARFPLLLPSFDVQLQIVNALQLLDDKIDLNRRMNAALEDTARALFKSWFVDFDPVRAKSEGRDPDGMDAETAALFPDSFEDSELGLIPRGWEISSIGNEVRVVGGSTPSTKEAQYWDDGIFAWATPKDLSNLGVPVLLETSRQITEDGLSQISSGLLPESTVLLSSRAPIGYLAIAEIPVAINQGFIAMICDRQLSNHYILRWAEINMDVIKGNANGTTFQEISKGNFRPILVLVPPFEVLEAFNMIAAPLHEEMVNNERESRTLTETRDALLPKLVSGEIRIEG